MDELVSLTLDESIYQQAIEVARRYPELNIRCFVCAAPILGANYLDHISVHQNANIEENKAIARMWAL